MKKNFLYLLFGFLSFIFVMYLVNNDWIKDKYVLNNWNIDLPFYSVNGRSETIFLETNFDDLGYDTLVLPKISGNILKVYLNEKIIYTIGTKTSNIWSRVIVVNLDRQLIKEKNNKLKLENFGLYDVGIHKIPFLATYEDAAKYSTIMNFLRSDFYLISLGISFISGIISFIFSYGLKNEKGKNLNGAYKSFGVFLILISIYLFDYQFRLTTFNEGIFLGMKKLFIISGYLSIVFYLYGIETYKLKRFASKWLLYIIFPVVAIILISSDFITYLKVTPYTNLLMIPILIYVLIRLLRLRLEKLYFSTFFAVFAFVQTIFAFSQIFTSGYAVIAISVGLIIMLSSDFKMITIENYILNKKAFTDPLTHAYNRNILNELIVGGYFILIDLDNFKAINDKYGHQKGDELLKKFVEVVKAIIRNEDLLIRIGGDEFAIITKSDKPEYLVERIRKEVKNKLNIEFSYGIEPYTDFSEAYKKADEKVYKMKQVGKQNVF
ncbi:MAG: hypothetical protein PWP54_1308 [Thermosipho sp. (in: thermotogales)]|nr:hypothetical protein [Thermosipho sp. (in: thermotogales)]